MSFNRRSTLMAKFMAAVMAALFGLVLLSGCSTDETIVGAGDDPGTQVDRSMGVDVNIGFYNPEVGMRIFVDGYNTALWTAADQPWDPDFLADMAPFETIRFHQFHLVSFSNDVQWSDRTPPNTQLHLSGWHDVAVPYEWEIRLSNRLGANYWLNVPAKADSAYIAELAALVHEQLDSNLDVYLEYSNEVWNPDYSEGAYWDDVPGFNGQFTVASERGMDMGLSDDPNVARSHYYVYASVRIWQAFVDEFDDDSRLIKVLASVNDDEFFWDGGMQMDALADPTINPRGLRPDRFSLAAYVGAEHDGASSTLFTSELPADLDGLLRGYRVARAGLDAAGYADVELNSYEGGTHVLRNADVGNRSPAIYDFYLDFLSSLEAEGLSSFQHYVATAEHEEWAAFGFKEFTGQPEGQAPKWRALRDWIEGG